MSQVDFLGQTPTSPISSAFSLRPICHVDFLSQTPKSRYSFPSLHTLLCRCPGSKPPQVLSHLCFPWLRPICQVDFLGQAPASPIWSAFSGRRFPLLRPICQVDFLSQTPTNPTWFSGHCFSFAAPNLPGRLPGSKTKSSVWFAFSG